ncbi:MAG: hypothetical protein ACRDBM_03100, partial [Sporomusa sp.]
MIDNKRMKQRGGTYGNFNKSQCLDREVNVITGGDPDASDGRSVHISFEPGVTKRLATVEDLQVLLDMSDEARAALDELIVQMGEQTVLAGLLSDINALKSGDNTVGFTQAGTRVNIDSTDSVRTIFGKIMKWFADLGTAAFRGVSNTLTQTSAGSYVLDAYQGKVLDDKITS